MKTTSTKRVLFESAGIQTTRGLLMLLVGLNSQGNGTALVTQTPGGQLQEYICQVAPHRGKCEPGTFIAIGDSDTIISSADTVTWLPGAFIQKDQFNWPRQAIGNGVIVRIGPKTGIETSTDGRTWTIRHSPIPNRLYAVAFGSGLFVAVGNEGALVTSPDGVKWVTRNSRTDQRLRGAAFGNRRFVVVGYYGAVLCSNNGRHWRCHISGTQERLLDVAYGDGAFVAVGWNGTVLRSTNSINWNPASSGTSSQLHRVVFRATPS